MSSPPPTQGLPRARLRRFLWRSGLVLIVTAALLLLCRQVLFQGPYQPPHPLPQSPIVDLHCHVAGVGAGNSGCFVSPRLRSNIRFRIYLDAFGVTEADLTQHGDMLLPQRLSEQIAQSRHLTGAVILALDGPVDSAGNLDTNRTEVYVPNAFVHEATLRFTNLLFGASIHPGRTDAIARLDEAAHQGAVLIKWIPSVMDIDPADPRYIPFYQRLAHYRIPLLSHTGPENAFTTALDHLADPERLRLPLSQGVIVIAGHASAGSETDGYPDLQKLQRLMREFPNLYADISALTQMNRIGALKATLAATECQGRLVYGSDFPLINTALVSPWYFPLELTEAQRKTIADLANPWDRDITLKQALGVPADVFTKPATLLPQNSAMNPRATR